MQADPGTTNQGMCGAAKAGRGKDDAPLQPWEGAWPLRRLGPPGLRDDSSAALAASSWQSVMVVEEAREKPSPDSGLVWFCLWQTSVQFNTLPPDTRNLITFLMTASRKFWGIH